MMRQAYHENLTVIIGLGATGLSCVRYLISKGVRLAINDSRQNPPYLDLLQQEFPEIPCVLGYLDRDLLNQAQCLVVSPGVSLQSPEIMEQIERGVEIIGDIELFARIASAPIVAITGSNGKSTVTTLVGQMVSAAGFRVGVGGNIGRPALDLLSTDTDYYVLELSSFQLETTYSLKTAAATILNISADHMDRYPNLSLYCAAKQRIYQHCEQPIVNLTQPDTWQSLHFLREPISFGLSLQADYGFSSQLKDQMGYLLYRKEPILSVSALPLQQLHYIENALAALALGSAIHLPLEAMINVLSTFAGLPHRCQLVGSQDGIAWYNDSKGTNVGATIAALLSLGVSKKNSLILIAGGDAKNADLTPLWAPITTYVDQLILLGRDAPAFYQLFHHDVSCLQVASMFEAVAAAKAVAQPGDIVLLSPACASLDMFNNYEHRGDVFMQCVRELSLVS